MVECRAVNELFRDCPPIPMGSGSSWSELVLGEGGDMHVTLSDIKCFFYACGIPMALSELLCLPPLTGAEWNYVRGLADEVMVYGPPADGDPDAISP